MNPSFDYSGAHVLVTGRNPQTLAAARRELPDEVHEPNPTAHHRSEVRPSAAVVSQASASSAAQVCQASA